MVNTYTYKKIEWVDLTSPTQEEVRSVMEKYKLHPVIAEGLLQPTLRPRVDMFPNCIYLILHFPAWKHTHQDEQQNQEVDFVIGKDFLITTHYDSIDPLHKFSKIFEVNSILDKADMGDHAGFIFYHMIKKLYRSLHHELEYIGSLLSKTEDRIFSGQERRMVHELSRISRELLRFKQALALHDDVLSSFEVGGRSFFGEKFEYHLRDIYGAYRRISRAVDTNIDALNELRETNNSLLSTKQNETMQILTSISLLTMPLALLAALFGMSSTSIPIISSPQGFWDVLKIMGGVVLFLIVVFRWQKWI